MGWDVAGTIKGIVVESEIAAQPDHLSLARDRAGPRQRGTALLVLESCCETEYSNPHSYPLDNYM